MRKNIAQLRVLSRNSVPNARSGKARVSSARIVSERTDWGVCAKSATEHTSERFTGKTRST